MSRWFGFKTFASLLRFHYQLVRIDKFCNVFLIQICCFRRVTDV